jgi:hypothetical protein
LSNLTGLKERLLSKILHLLHIVEHDFTPQENSERYVSLILRRRRKNS